MCRRTHAAREARRGRSILARITPGAPLPWILHRRTWHARRDRVNLHALVCVARADGGCRRIMAGERRPESCRAPAAEAAIAFFVAFAVVDRVEVIPDAQE